MIKMEPKTKKNKGFEMLMSQAGTVLLAKKIEAQAQQLADSMKSVHGGQWSVHVDHQVGLAMVRRH